MERYEILKKIAAEIARGEVSFPTSAVVALAQVLARRVTRLDPETALFAGIVHEVGAFYLVSRTRDYPGLLDEDFPAWSENGEAEVGRVLLKALAVPQPIIDGIELCWQGFLVMPPTTLGDMLLLDEGDRLGIRAR